jgi:ATP-dependent Clp protease ATP-binding subunit ClpA
MSWLKSFWEALVMHTESEGREFVESWNNFSPRAQQVLALARKEAERLHHNFVGTEHLLLGLIKLGQGTAVGVLEKMGLNLEKVRLEVEKLIGPGPDEVSDRIPYTPRTKKVLSLAAKEAKSLDHTYVGTEHILLGLLSEGDGVAARVLKNLGIDTEVTRQYILRELDPNSSFQPEESVTPPRPKPPKSEREPVDISRRYDVYSGERDQQVIYRNVLFKGVRTLFAKTEYDVVSEYLELEQVDGQTIFIARAWVIKFCEHGNTPSSEP